MKIGGIAKFLQRSNVLGSVWQCSQPSTPVTMNASSSVSGSSKLTSLEKRLSALFDVVWWGFKLVMSPFLFLVGKRVPFNESERNGPDILPEVQWIPGTPIFGAYRILPLLLFLIGSAFIWRADPSLVSTILICAMLWLSFGAVCLFLCLVIALISFAVGWFCPLGPRVYAALFLLSLILL